jgi:hypothetical protein
MAYVYDPSLSDEENKKLEEGQQPAPQGGGGGVLTGEAPAAGAPVSSGSGFTNLQKYLEANKDKGAQIAGQIAQSLNETATGARGATEALAQKGQEVIQSGSVAPKPELVQEAVTKPVEFTQDPAKLQEFTKMRTAQYAGPQSYTDLPEYETAQSKTAQAVERGKQIQTESGRMQLMRDLMTVPGQGKTALNQFLVQGEPTAASTIAATAPQFADLESYLSGTGNTLAEAIAQGKAQTESARTGVQEALYGQESPITSLQKSIQERTVAAEAERERVNTIIQNARAKLALGQPLSGMEYTAMGLYPQQYDVLEQAQTNLGKWYAPEMGVMPEDLSRFMSGYRLGETPAEASRIATPEEYAREAALEKLAGSDLNVLQNEAAAQAGTYQAPTTGGYEFDAARQALQDRIRALDAEYKAYVEHAPAETVVREAGGIPGPLGGRLALWKERNPTGAINYTLPEPSVPTTPVVPQPDPYHPLPNIDPETGEIIGWLGFV